MTTWVESLCLCSKQLDQRLLASSRPTTGKEQLISEASRTYLLEFLGPGKSGHVYLPLIIEFCWHFIPGSRRDAWSKAAKKTMLLSSLPITIQFIAQTPERLTSAQESGTHRDFPCKQPSNKLMILPTLITFISEEQYLDFYKSKLLFFNSSQFILKTHDRHDCTEENKLGGCK